MSMSRENIDGLGALTLAVPFRVRALYSATHEMALNWTAFWCLFHLSRNFRRQQQSAAQNDLCPHRRGGRL